MPAIVFSVTDTAQNIGQAPAGRSVTRYYLSDARTRRAPASAVWEPRRAFPCKSEPLPVGTVSVTCPRVFGPTPRITCWLALTTRRGGRPAAATGRFHRDDRLQPATAATTTTLTVTLWGTSRHVGRIGRHGDADRRGGQRLRVGKTGQVNFCDASAKTCTGIHLLGTAQLTTLGQQR